MSNLLSSYIFLGLLSTSISFVTVGRPPALLHTVLKCGNQLETNFLPDGFSIGPFVSKRPPRPKFPIAVSNLRELKELIYKGYRVVSKLYSRLISF
jgi:hypothetical protein